MKRESFEAGGGPPPRLRIEKGIQYKIESKESLREGSMGFDFGISTDGTPYCFEISDSQGVGVSGMGRIKDELIGARTKLLAEIWEEIQGDKNTRHRYDNPSWLKAICQNKWRQAEYIPDANRPETATTPGAVSLLFNKGDVVIKPSQGANGREVYIFRQDQREEGLRHVGKYELAGRKFVAQQFIELRGAERAPKDLEGHAHSLRLVVDFTTMNGHVIPTFVTGYQRVSALGKEDIGRVTGSNSRVLTEDDVYVVNLATGAEAVPMSEGEKERVLPVALAIIENLQKGGSATPEYKRDTNKALDKETIKLHNTFWSRYHVIVHDAYSTEKYAPSVRAALPFIELLNAQLESIDPVQLKKWTERRTPSITRLEDVDGRPRARVAVSSVKPAEAVIFLDEPKSVENALRDLEKKTRLFSF